MLSIILVLSFTSCIALIAILKKPQSSITTANAKTTITPNDILKGEHDEILKKKFSIAKKLPQFTSNQQKTSTALSPTVSQPTTPDLVVSTITRTPKYPRYCVTYNNGLPELCPDQNTGTKH